MSPICGFFFLLVKFYIQRYKNEFQFFSWYFLDFSASVDSKVVVLTINSLGNTQSYLDLVQNNVELFRSIIPSVAHYSQHSILLVASQPGMTVQYLSL